MSKAYVSKAHASDDFFFFKSAKELLLSWSICNVPPVICVETKTQSERTWLCYSVDSMSIMDLEESGESDRKKSESAKESQTPCNALVQTVPKEVKTVLTHSQ